MRHQLLRAALLASVVVAGTFVVRAATAEEPAELDRTFDGNDGLGTGGSGGMGGIGGTDGGTTMDGGRRGMDGGTGGVGGLGPRPNGGTMMKRGAADGGTGGSGGEGEAVQDDRARRDDHTNIIIYGPNGVPARDDDPMGE